ncbi:potassium channel family protein [Oceanobacillus manasiensis]|uniref:potassium channel family protein n=1 Tax=Oceanobacillus manasiensis TaxID=586413 RepID=UPI0005AA44F5|nr:potassium channel family protein [Oceanobacillus manasiensis]
MNTIYLIIGAIILIVTFVDIFWTALWVDGASGPLSKTFTQICWRALRLISRNNSKLLSLSGPLILLSTLLMWVLLIWCGWTLFFAADGTAFIDTENRGPISWTDRIYFTVFTLFTLGIGDFVPKEGFWQFATSIATGSGMLFVTFGVSYVLSVVGAVTQKRSFADNITGLAKNGETIIKQGWNGTDFRDIDLFLKDHASQLSTLTQQHKAYPILHYFHSENDDQASSVAVAIFDEALTLYTFGVPKQYQPNKVWIKEARSSVQSYLGTLNAAFINPSDNVPPSPDLNTLRSVDLPTVTDEEFESGLAQLKDRRKKLLGMVEADARSWPNVIK